MINKLRMIIIFVILAAIVFGVIMLGSLHEELCLSLKLAQNQRLIDYAFNEQWLFAIIEEKEGDDLGKNIFIYKSKDFSEKERWEKIAEYDFTMVSPWKIEIGNIDYLDGPQVIMGVDKTTYFDKEKNNRLFVFNWDGKKLYKKWTGTRLGYGLKDFYIMDFLDVKGDELVVIDKNQEGDERLLVYYWLDFGFQLLAESKFYDAIEEVRYLDNNLLELVYKEQSNKATAKVILKKGKIIEID